jgi:hypothetical protein
VPPGPLALVFVAFGPTLYWIRHNCYFSTTQHLDPCCPQSAGGNPVEKGCGGRGRLTPILLLKIEAVVYRFGCPLVRGNAAVELGEPPDERQVVVDRT